MAGSSHWSMTAEREANDLSLLLDIACRVKEEGAILGSSYRSIVRHELSGGSVLLHRPGGTGSPAIVEIVDSAASLRWEIDTRGLRLTVDGAISPSQTVRWTYRMKISG
jgi:hypothetical protein